jgi:hypothetical protein
MNDGVNGTEGVLEVLQEKKVQVTGARGRDAERAGAASCIRQARGCRHQPTTTKLCEDSGAFETAWLPAASRRSHAQFTVRLRAPSAMGCFRRRWDRVETHVDAQ